MIEHRGVPTPRMVPHGAPKTQRFSVSGKGAGKGKGKGSGKGGDKPGKNDKDPHAPCKISKPG